MSRRFIQTRNHILSITPPIVPDATSKGFWRYDSNSLDSSSNGFHAVTGTSNTFVTGHLNNALSTQQGAYAAYKSNAPVTNLFTGTDSLTITGNSGITMGGWFYKRTSGGSNQAMLHLGHTDANGGFGFYIPNGTNNQVYIFYAGITTYTGCTLTDDTWSFLTFTLDQFLTSGIYYGKLYKDGNLVQTVTNNTPRKPVQSKGFQMGGWADLANYQFFGYMDDIFINKGPVWTADEVLAYYNATK